MVDLRRLPAVTASVLLLAVMLLMLLATPVLAQDEPPTDVGQGAPVDLGVYGTPLRFVAPDGVTLELSFPGDDPGETTSYTGTVEVRSAGDDLTVINALSMEAYVEGLAEMPARWPVEALKAQAVAARTYAWFELRQGRWNRYGFDICATTACQVFHGREVVQDPEHGQRWKQAVEETVGEVLTYDGAPILARYFSTSGGATRNNEHVFPNEGPRPYLKGVDDPDDAVSPLHRWTASFTREQMNEILAQGESLSAAVPLADITHLTAPGGGADRVRVTSQDGEVVELSASSFRAFVSEVAEELYPDVYPQERSDGRPLPTTLPSSRFDVTVTEDRVTIEGRGWGHGVGLGQFGAMGKAERGFGYREIIAAYYNGLEPSRPDALPDRIRVGLTTDAEGLVVSADGPFQVVTGDVVITERGLGRWRVDPAGAATMRLAAPTGYGAPLVVAPTETSRLTPYAVERITATTVVNKSTELSLEVRDRTSDELIVQRPLGIVEAGRHEAEWDLDDAEGRQVAPGDYEVRLVAVDEERAVGGEAVSVEVRAPIPAGEPEGTLLKAVPATDLPARSPWLAISAVAGLVVGMAAGRVIPVRS